MKKQQLPFRYLQGPQDSVQRSAHRGHDLPGLRQIHADPGHSCGRTKNPFNPDAGKTRFVDVSDNAWYASAVNYVVDKGLMNGTGEDKFSPNADTTRGMIVTVLARLDGKSTAGTPWYAAGQRWASRPFFLFEYLPWAVPHLENNRYPFRSNIKKLLKCAIDKRLF